MDDRPAIAVLAPAKLNLALAVGAPGADGMHPICSWMVTIDLYDELQVMRLPPDRLSRYAILWHADARRTSDIDWSITKDLAVRAHLALEDRLARRLPLQLKLEKRIPVGGGLGGGSTNAAAMLHAVNTLFELDLGSGELAEIGAGLGADVPFLVRGGSAVVEGVGERLDHHPDAIELHLVVVFPDQRCPTGSVYRRFDDVPAEPMRSEAVRALVRDAMTKGAPNPSPESLFNDLTRAATGVAPGLEADLTRVGDLAERPAQLSGSGSSIFVVCDDPLHACHLAEAIESGLEIPAVAVRSAAGPTIVAPDTERSAG